MHSNPSAPLDFKARLQRLDWLVTRAPAKTMMPYYEGCIAYGREHGGDGLTSAEVRRLANLLWRMQDEGFCHLVQKRVGLMDSFKWAYYAVPRSHRRLKPEFASMLRHGK